MIKKHYSRLLFFLLLLSITILSIDAQNLELKINNNVKKVRLNKYETDYQFSDGLLAVKNVGTGKWGFIDERGNLIIGYLWRFISYYEGPTSGNVLQPKFSNDKAWVYNDNGELSILDKNGNSILKKDILKFSDFCNGYAAVIKKNRGTEYFKYLYVNREGKEVFPAINQTIHSSDFDPYCPKARPFSDGVAAFYAIEKNRCGFIDSVGRILLPAIYLAAQDFSEGMSAVLVEPSSVSESKWGFIDTSGKFVIPAKFSNQPSPFYNGLSTVVKVDGSIVSINKAGNIVNVVKEVVSTTQSNQGYAVSTMSRSLRSWEYDLYTLDISLQYYIYNNYVCDHYGNNKFKAEVKSEWGRKFDETEKDYIDFVKSGYKIDFVNDKLMHCQTYTKGNIGDDIINDGFVDYDGNYIFIFSKEEF